MFNIVELIAIIVIIIFQFIITIRAYRKISQTKSFLPKGRESLALKEYEIPIDEILKLEPSQVVDKRKYLAIERPKEKGVNERPRDEKGRFISDKILYSSSLIITDDQDE